MKRRNVPRGARSPSTSSRCPKKTAGGKKARSAAASGGSRSSARTYTKPALRERLKEEITRSSDGGRRGQWSARKAQLLAQRYEAEGGGYTSSKRTAAQKHLSQWTREDWTTRDGARARRGSTTARYLPKQAWDELSPEQAEATDEKKRRVSRSGRQFVANTAPAKRARKKATRRASKTSSASASRPRTNAKESATAKKKTTTRRRS